MTPPGCVTRTDAEAPLTRSWSGMATAAPWLAVTANRLGPQPMSTVHCAAQPSFDVWLSSSHCSPGSTTPLPQPCVTPQPLLQPSFGTSLASSHSSPRSTVVLPQGGACGLVQASSAHDTRLPPAPARS